MPNNNRPLGQRINDAKKLSNEEMRSDQEKEIQRQRAEEEAKRKREEQARQEKIRQEEKAKRDEELADLAGQLHQLRLEILSFDPTFAGPYFTIAKREEYKRFVEWLDTLKKYLDKREITQQMIDSLREKWATSTKTDSRGIPESFVGELHYWVEAKRKRVE